MEIAPQELESSDEQFLEEELQGTLSGEELSEDLPLEEMIDPEEIPDTVMGDAMKNLLSAISALPETEEEAMLLDEIAELDEEESPL